MEKKIVELDATFMDGETLSFGAIGAVQSEKTQSHSKDFSQKKRLITF